MSDPLTLRPASVTDTPALLAIEQACFTGSLWTGQDFAAYDVTLALWNGEPAGFLVSRQVVPGEREILNLAVVPNLRRRGIARSLLRAELARRGLFFLEVRESNLAGRQLYQREGFVAIGTRANYYAVPPETAIVMRLEWC